MTERTIQGRDVYYELEGVEDDEELEKYLELIVPYVGWIVVYFNSLEGIISDFIREAILRAPYKMNALMYFCRKCSLLASAGH